jgi:hypothetical protein
MMDSPAEASAPFINNENKHHCQSGEGLAPAGDFSADLSVFQAHLPWQLDITSKPLVCDNSPGRGNRAMQVLEPVMMT